MQFVSTRDDRTIDGYQGGSAIGGDRLARFASREPFRMVSSSGIADIFPARPLHDAPMAPLRSARTLPETALRRLHRVTIP